MNLRFSHNNHHTFTSLTLKITQTLLSHNETIYTIWLKDMKLFHVCIWICIYYILFNSFKFHSINKPQNSAIGQRFGNGDLQGILLGDSGYRLESWLMTPVRVPLSDAERTYNRLDLNFWIFNSGGRDKIDLWIYTKHVKHSCLITSQYISYTNLQCKGAFMSSTTK